MEPIDLNQKRQARKQAPRIKRVVSHGAYRSDVVYAERIVWMREFRGQTQQQFAKELDISEEEMQAWESGTSQPDLEQLKNLEEVTGFKVGWFCQPVNDSWPALEKTSLIFHT